MKDESHFVGRQRKGAYSRQRNSLSKHMLCHVCDVQGNASISPSLVLQGMRVGGDGEWKEKDCRGRTSSHGGGP